MFNYEKLMSFNPFIIDKMINSKGQEIHFLEHPTKGDEVEVICACPEIQKAEYSGFYETDDMLAEHGEYEPWFDSEGRLNIGELGLAKD